MATVFTRLIVDGEDHGVHAVLVPIRDEDGTPKAGVRIADRGLKLGLNGVDNRQIWFDQVTVPVENLLGEVGKGHKIAFNILNVGRFKLGVGCVGGAKLAFDDSLRYAGERSQFGQPIINFGMMKNKVADMASQIYAIESMSYRTAGLLDAILDPIDKEAADFSERTMKGIEEYATECSILKIKGSEGLDFIVDEAALLTNISSLYMGLHNIKTFSAYHMNDMPEIVGKMSLMYGIGGFSLFGGNAGPGKYAAGGSPKNRYIDTLEIEKSPKNDRKGNPVYSKKFKEFLCR